MAQQLDRESAADADVFFSNYRGGLAVAYNFDPGTVDFFELRNGSNIIWAVEEDDKIVISNVAYLKNKNFFDSLNKDIAFRGNPLSLNEPTLARTHAQYFPYVHLLHIAKRLSKLTDIQINRMKKVYTDQGYEHTDVHNNFIMAHLMHLNKSFVAAYEEYADSFLGKNIKVRLSDVKRSESQPQGAKLYKTQESFEFAMLLAIHACGKSYHATNYSTSVDKHLKAFYASYNIKAPDIMSQTYLTTLFPPDILKSYQDFLPVNLRSHLLGAIHQAKYPKLTEYLKTILPYTGMSIIRCTHEMLTSGNILQGHLRPSVQTQALMFSKWYKSRVDHHGDLFKYMWFYFPSDLVEVAQAKYPDLYALTLAYERASGRMANYQSSILGNIKLHPA